jgi:translation initiation factor IF-2
MRRGDSWRVQKFQDKAGLEEGDGTIRIPIIVKADADGSLSAVRESLIALGVKSKHKVLIDPVSDGIGEITPSDILMAKESQATIFSFGNKRIEQNILNMAESEGVEICSNDIIYSLLDEARDKLGNYLPSIPEERVHGRASVQAIFTIDTPDGKEKVAGLKVTDGYIYHSKAPGESKKLDLKCHFRILRDGKRISPVGETVTASSLRRFKELVESVRLGDECGLALSGFDEFEEGDEIECYSIEMKSVKL